MSKGKNKKNKQTKFIRLRNIILILLMICCLVGYGIVSSQRKKAEADYMQRVNSLPTLTTTAQILDAIKNPQPGLYVINNYQFPKYKLVSDPKQNTAERFLYISVSVSQKGKDGKYHDRPNSKKTVYGRLFFDDNTELLNFNRASISTAGASFNRSRGEYSYHYSVLEPDAKLSFIAQLGNNSAKVSGFDGNIDIVEGKKERLASYTEKYIKYLMLNIALGIASGLFGLFVFSDYLTIKEEKEKRLNRQRSKAGMKKQKTISDEKDIHASQPMQNEPSVD